MRSELAVPVGGEAFTQAARVLGLENGSATGHTAVRGRAPALHSPAAPRAVTAQTLWPGHRPPSSRHPRRHSSDLSFHNLHLGPDRPLRPDPGGRSGRARRQAVVWVGSGSCNGTPGTGGQTTDLPFSQFWGLQVRDQAASVVRFLLVMGGEGGREGGSELALRLLSGQQCQRGASRLPRGLPSRCHHTGHWGSNV